VQSDRPALSKASRVGHTIEDILCCVSLLFLTLIPALDSALRFFAQSRFPAAPLLVSHILLVLGLVSGMITTREGEHLSIGLFRYINNEKKRASLAICGGLLSTFLSTIFMWCALSFVKVGLYPPQIVGFIPDWVFALVMPLGFAVIAWRFARRTVAEGCHAAFVVFAVVLGTLCSAQVIFKCLWGLNLPDAAWAISDFLNSAAAAVKVPVIILLIAAALAGTPLFVVIGGIALILVQGSWGEIDIVANQIYTALTDRSLVAIPLFTLTGFILSQSRAGERLIVTFKSFFGWIPGGMIIVTVILCAFFTSFTGASGVTILAMGGVLLAVLKGYPEKFTIGLLTASGSIGLLFPPSLPILLVGAATRTNTAQLFLGGVLPGIILVAAMIIFGIIVTIKNKVPIEKFSPRKSLSSLKGSILEILLPFFLIIGYFTGVLSLVEISAAAVIYVFIVEVVIYREIPLKGMLEVVKKTIPIIGGILAILALAQALSYYIVDSRVPEFFADWMQATIHSKWLFLLLLNIALLITGCLIDIFSAIMIVLPLIFPLAAVYGIDPVHLGIIFLVNMEAGFLTPPVGLNLFLASYRFEKPYTETARNVMPFLVIQLIVVVAITYIPALSMSLANLY
jgi:tripartite ATP-independent transporter DctM subunit